MSILIRNILLQGKRTDIAIEGNRISRIAPMLTGTFDTVLDGSHQAVIPPFYNTHSHAVMTLLRGLADDMELFDWLQNHIWPAEARLQEEDFYWGSRLACMEMIRSGTVFFNDMYFLPQATIRAVEELGMRGCIGLSTLEAAGEEKQAGYERDNQEALAHRGEYSSRIQLARAPHAIYTVGEKKLRWVRDAAAAEGVMIHIHLAETRQEVQDCLAAHNCTPTAYLEKIGLLGPRTVTAHTIHCTDEDIRILADTGTVVSHNPCSNFKLCSGSFRFHRMMESHVHVTLGTDGCASNNNLSMFDEMKAAALNAKLEFSGPTGCSTGQVFLAATKNGAEAFGIDAGVIAEGKLADLLLLDLDSPMMVADHNLISNCVYAADSSVVSTVVCDGRILMRDRVIPGMQETLDNARRCARRLAAR